MKHSLSAALDRLHYRARQHRWLHFFAVFNRVMLAAGFFPSGLVKVLGQRFTDLAVNHPLGHYLDALYRTGVYYTFVGVMQMTAAVLLLIPRTALLGALLYLPIITNILVLSLSVRFQGSLLTAPLMLLANLYLLCWDYHRLRLIFPWHTAAATASLPPRAERHYRLPWRGGLAALGAVAAVFCGVAFTRFNVLMPRNRLPDCQSQCARYADPAACMSFCDCVHTAGRPLGECLVEFDAAGN